MTETAADIKLKICNMAMDKLHVTIIADYTTTPQGLLIARHYDNIIENNLKKHEWDFAVKKATLINSDWVTSHSYSVGDLAIESDTLYQCLTTHTSGTFATDLAAAKWEEVPEFGFTYKHKLPTDCLRIIEVDKDEKAEYKADNTYIESDLESIDIEYIYDVDETKFTSEFKILCAIDLARTVCYPLTDDHNREKELNGDYTIALIEAINIDTLNNPIKQPTNNGTWIEDRI